MRRCSPDSTSRRSPDSPDRDVHLTPRTGSRDPRRHRFDTVVAAFIAACRAAVLSERTIEFYLEGPDSYRAFAGGDEHDLTLADLDLGRRPRLAGRLRRAGPQTGHRRGPGPSAPRVSHWIVTEEYVRADPLARLKIPTIPRTIVETFTTSSR